MKKGKEKNAVQEATSATEERVVHVRKGNKVVSTIINIVLIIAIILAAICTYVSFVSTSGNGVPSILGIRPFSIQTDSMYPTLKPGDLIISTAVKDTGKLKEGDIITYWTVINGERKLNTHRITDIYDGGGHLIFATKGDNSDLGDALTVHESEVVGKYSFKIGGLGKVFDYLQTSTGFLLIVIIPVLIFFIYHLVQFFRVLFEYQNVKNRIKYEQERGRNEDVLEAERRKLEDSKDIDRAALEAELREKLKAELLADLIKQETLKEEVTETETEESESKDSEAEPKE